MRKKGRPNKQNSEKVEKVPGKRGRPRKVRPEEDEPVPKKARKRGRPRIKVDPDAPEEEEDPKPKEEAQPDENYSEGLHMSTMQVRALSSLIACLDCGEEVVLGVRPTTKGMISEFTVSCKVCDSQKSTNTPNLIRERKRKREKKGIVLQKNENINYAHVAAYLDNGLGYSGLRHYCKYLNARCLNEATFIVYAKQVISDVVCDTEEFLQQNARIVRRALDGPDISGADMVLDLTVGYTTTYHQWGSDFCLVAGAVIELQTGLVIDYDVGNMYCHVCKINAKKIVSMNPSEMTQWFNKHQDTCEIREWCDEIDQDSEEGIKEIDPKYLEAFIAKKIWSRSLEKFGFRYTTMIHESDERIHMELKKAEPYNDVPVLIDTITNCFSRRKSEHARTAFQNKLKAKCPRERVQTKDRIMYVYSMSIPEYNKFAIGSNIRLRELVRRIEIEEEQENEFANADLVLETEEEEVAPLEEQQPEDANEIGDAFEFEAEDSLDETNLGEADASGDGTVMEEEEADETSVSQMVEELGVVEELGEDEEVSMQLQLDSSKEEHMVSEQKAIVKSEKSVNEDSFAESEGEKEDEQKKVAPKVIRVSAQQERPKAEPSVTGEPKKIIVMTTSKSAKAFEQPKTTAKTSIVVHTDKAKEASKNGLADSQEETEVIKPFRVDFGND